MNKFTGVNRRMMRRASIHAAFAFMTIVFEDKGGKREFFLNDDNISLASSDSAAFSLDETDPLSMEFATQASRGEPANLENKVGLAEDLGFLSRMPELYDVTFFVGDKREPVGAVRAILAARSRVFHKLLYSHHSSVNCTPKKKSHSGDHRGLPKKVSMLIRRNSFDTLGEQEGSKPRVIIIEEFEPAVFRQLVDYCHTGCVTLKPRTVLGLLNAADHYGLEELRRACLGFLHGCISIETVCLLLRSAERYIQYKATKSLVQKVLEFVDVHGEDILRLPAFASLPEHVVRLILIRDELQADEFTKFQAAITWCKSKLEKQPGTDLKTAMAPFVECISFHLMPATTLMQHVKPTQTVSDQKIMTALAYQADPSSVDPSSLPATPTRLRLSQLNLSIQDEPSWHLSDTSSHNSLDVNNELDRLSIHSNRTGPTTPDPTSPVPDIKKACEIRFDDSESDDDDENFDESTQAFSPISPTNGPFSDSHSVSCSMSTCSDFTDTGSSVGSSFGKADQKDNLYQMEIPEHPDNDEEE